MQRKNNRTFDYYLTTIFLKNGKRTKAKTINMCPWRSWIACVTPTHEAAGSNPAGHTIIVQAPKAD